MSLQMEKKSKKQQELKHLGFVRSASLLLLAWMSKLYEFMKQHLGPLQSIVTTVERIIINPAHEESKAISNNLILFADKKVDEAVQIFGKNAPFFVKKIASLIIWFMKTATEIFEEARKGGLNAVRRYVVLHITLFIISHSMKTLDSLGYLPQIPLFGQFTDQLSKLSSLPIAGQLVEDVADAAKKGFEDVTDAVEDVAKKGVEFADNVADAVEDIAKKGMGFGKSAAENVTGTVEDIAKTGLDLGQSAVENVTGTVEDIAKTGLGLGQSAVENVTGTVEDIAKTGLGLGQSAVENVTGSIEDIAKTGLGFGQSAVGNLTGRVNIAETGLGFLPFGSADKKNKRSK